MIMENRFLLLTLLILYLVILTTKSLWPFRFDFDRNNNARWKKKTNGIEFRKKGQLITTGQTDYLFSKLTKGTGLTIAVWVRAYNSFQDGPARILSYSLDPYFRNFTLAQSKDRLIMRLRTTETDLNGINPHLEISNIFDDLEDLYIVVTYNYDKQCVYINGEIRECKGKVKGNFSNWDSTHQLVIGNEVTGDRPWLGEIFYAAIYDRALTDKDVVETFKAGRSSGFCPSNILSNCDAGPVVCYLFNEKIGSKISDKTQNTFSTDLYIPEKLPPKQEKPFEFSKRIISKDLEPLNLIFNIIGFIPLGFLLYAYLNTYRCSNQMIIFCALIIGFLIAFGVEYLHHFLPSKHSSAVELCLKVIGISLGMVFYSGLQKEQLHI